MNADSDEMTFEQWLSTRPKSVQELAREFPLGSQFNVRGKTVYLVGYTEDDMLIVSEINPTADYDSAYASRVYLCASHARPDKN